jgi:ribose 5-phosphate isomerase B
MAHTIALACDHAGYSLKAVIHEALLEQGFDVLDLGCHSEDDKVDYPEQAKALALAMKEQDIARGIITCGSGVGVQIAANRHPWIRAVHAHDAHLAKLSREHNDSNVLCIGGRFVAPAYGLTIVDSWLSGVFEGERHQPRVGMLECLGIEA